MKTMDLNTRLSMKEAPERIEYLKKKGNAIFEATYENKDGTPIQWKLAHVLLSMRIKMPFWL